MRVIDVLAYVDPTSGGFLLQLLYGGVAGAAVIVKLQWNRITRAFSRSKPPAGIDEKRESNEPGVIPGSLENTKGR